MPAQIEAHIAPFVSRLVNDEHFHSFTWAVHPGGKSIVDSIAKVCELQPEQLTSSWKVLKQYGNMSSPTFLFVLKEVLNEPSSQEKIIGLGFGPGLSVEGILLKRCSQTKFPAKGRL